MSEIKDLQKTLKEKPYKKTVEALRKTKFGKMVDNYQKEKVKKTGKKVERKLGPKGKWVAGAVAATILKKKVKGSKTLHKSKDSKLQLKGEYNPRTKEKRIGIFFKKEF